MVQLPEQTDEKSEAYKAGYKNICEIGKERIRRAGDKIVSENKDIVILSDIKADILDVLNIIQKSNYSGNIHLILPLPFGKITKGTMQYKILSDLSKVKSIAVYDPYKLAMKKYNGIDNDIIEKIINEQTSHLLNRLDAKLWFLFYRFQLQLRLALGHLYGWRLFFDFH